MLMKKVENTKSTFFNISEEYLVLYRERYFFQLKEVQDILDSNLFFIKKKIKRNQIFAIRIGVSWRIFLDLNVEKGLISSTNFWIPERLKAQYIADILNVSLEVVERYIMKKYVFSMSRKDFVNFLYKNSNLMRDEMSEVSVIPAMVSAMVSKC